MKRSILLIFVLVLRGLAAPLTSNYTTVSAFQIGQVWPTAWGASGTLGIFASQNFVAPDGKAFVAGTGQSITSNFVVKVNITVASGVATVASFSLPKTDLSAPNTVRYSARIFDARGAARDYLFNSFHLRASLGDSINYQSWWNDNQQQYRPQMDTYPTTTQMNTAIAAALGSNAVASTTQLGTVKISKTPVDSSSPIARGANDAGLVQQTTSDACGPGDIFYQASDHHYYVCPTTNNPVPVLDASSFSDQYSFGAFCDGTSHTITGGDITAHPQWLGTYTVGTEWDTVAIQELFYYAYGTGSPTRWSTRTEWLNKEIKLGSGKCLINKGLQLTGVVGANIHGVRKSTLLYWTGTNPDEAMWTINGFAYGRIGDFSLVAGAPNNVALLDIDWTGGINTLKQQQLTLENIDFGGSGIAKVGHRWNQVSQGSGQGDTILISNCNESDFTFAGASMIGSNMLAITVLNGDMQGNLPYGYYMEGAQVHFIDKHCEMGGSQKAQVDAKGFCFYSPTNGAVDGTPVIVEGARTEAPQVAWGVNVIRDSNSRVGFNGTWSANSYYAQGSIVADKFYLGPLAPGTGRMWIQINPDPSLSAYADIVSPFDTSTLTISTPIVAGSLVGKQLSIRFPNCFALNTDFVDANTTTTIHLASPLPFSPGDVPGQPCGSGAPGHSQYAVYASAYPKTGSSPPSWNSVPTSVYYSGLSPSIPGVCTTAGSNVITGDAIGGVTPLYGLANGLDVVIAGAGIGGSDLITTVTDASDSTHVVLADNASTTNTCYAGGGNPPFGTPLRAASGLTDNTAKWIPFEFFHIYSPPRGEVTNFSSNFGRIFAGDGSQISRSSFTRYDWLQTGGPANPTTAPAHFVDFFNQPGWLTQEDRGGLSLNGHGVSLFKSAFNPAVSPPLATTTPVDIGSTLLLGNIVPYAPTQDATIDIATVPNQEFTLIVTTSGTTSYTITFGTNFKTTGTLATGTVDAKVFTLRFACNGTICAELSRTTAM